MTANDLICARIRQQRQQSINDGHPVDLAAPPTSFETFNAIAFLKSKESRDAVKSWLSNQRSSDEAK